MAKDDTLNARYAELQEAARAVNHELRVVAIPGPPVRPGSVLTVKPIEADAMTLEGALEWVAGYVTTDEARERGELYRRRTEAEAEYIEALTVVAGARRTLRAVEADVARDTDRATDTVSLDVDEPITDPA